MTNSDNEKLYDDSFYTPTLQGRLRQSAQRYLTRGSNRLILKDEFSINVDEVRRILTVIDDVIDAALEFMGRNPSWRMAILSHAATEVRAIADKLDELARGPIPPKP